MKYFFYTTLCVLTCSFTACLQLGEPFNKIPPGEWRGVLVLNEDTTVVEEKTKGELPFNFEVVYGTADSFHIVIRNGEERIVVKDITMGVDRRTARDTIRIDFPVYDSYITAQYEEDAIEGWWVVRNRKDYKIRFKALHGRDFRFSEMPAPPAMDLTGRWLCKFGIETDQSTTSIGDFKQDGNRITGTFLSPTGDDRFLEGEVNGDRLFLSVFDGAHAYLYEAKILPDSSITGVYRSGNHYKTYWEGSRNDTIELHGLGDPMTMTTAISQEPVSLSFTDPDGNVVTLDQAPYAGAPKIIQIMGTWCPNCRDETDFILDYLNTHPDPGFELLGISFERHTDTLQAMNAIRTYKEKMMIPYTLVYGGSNNKDSASEALPMISKVMAFPTLLFLNDRNQIVAIHTGFSGPATKEYEEFKKEFDGLVEKMKRSI